MAQPEHVAGTAEQMARNDAIFREANERIDSYVQSMDEPVDGPLPFLCECADDVCHGRVELTPIQWEDVTAKPNHFVMIAGHLRSEGEEVVGTVREYEIARKPS